MTDLDGCEAGRISVLGPIACVDDEGTVRRLSGQIARVAAWLVAHRGQLVPTGTLRSLLWPDPRTAPTDPARAVRRLIREAAAELTSVPGVAVDLSASAVTLRIPVERLDADVFAGLVEDLRNEPDDPTIASLSTELLRWRGDPYPELDDRVGEVPEVFRLLDLREQARLGLFARRAAGPVDPSLVADLSAMAVNCPDDVRVHYLLAVALYRAGCRAEALRAVQECGRAVCRDGARRAAMVDELEAAILDGSPFGGDLDVMGLV